MGHHGPLLVHLPSLPGSITVMEHGPGKSIHEDNAKRTTREQAFPWCIYPVLGNQQLKDS